MNEEKPVTSDNQKLSPKEIKRVKGLGCLQDNAPAPQRIE